MYSHTSTPAYTHTYTQYLAAPAVCPLDPVLLSLLLTGLLNQWSPSVMEKDKKNTKPLTGLTVLIHLLATSY